MRQCYSTYDGKIKIIMHILLVDKYNFEITEIT